MTRLKSCKLKSLAQEMQAPTLSSRVARSKAQLKETHIRILEPTMNLKQMLIAPVVKDKFKQDTSSRQLLEN
jgi:hypothetical protein